MKKIILVTGANSRFCQFLRKDLKKYKTFFTTKKQFDILNLKKMEKFLKSKKIKYLIKPGSDLNMFLTLMKLHLI